jgi:hypothetical protein
MVSEMTHLLYYYLPSLSFSRDAHGPTVQKTNCFPSIIPPGAGDVKRLAFFQKYVDWDEYYSPTLIPPFVPKLKSHFDSSAFEVKEVR